MSLLLNVYSPCRLLRNRICGHPLATSFVIALLLSLQASAAVVVPTGAPWRWLPGTAEASAPVDAWRRVDFNDQSFTTAPAPFWFGDALPGGTQISGMQGVYRSIFLRKTFTISNFSQIGGLRLNALVDDGFVAWINGKEVLRVNMSGAADSAVSITTEAINAQEPVSSKVYELPAPPSYLVTGTNVLAVQVFQSSLGSSDLGFEASLETIITETIPPTIASIAPPAGSTLNQLSQLTVTFSEPVNGVTAAHLLVSGIPASGVTALDSATYLYTFLPPAYGEVSITWNSAHTITDQALPPNRFNAQAPNASWNYTLVDNSPPGVAAISPSAGATVRSLTNLTVLFTEPVSGVSANDLLINDKPAASVTPAGGSQFLFTFPEPPTGAVRLAWAATHGITDQSPAANRFAGGTWTYRLDPNALDLPPYISEVLVSNTRILADETGRYNDWIEIYNPAAVNLNLEGWYLTDSANDLRKWRFPATNLAGGRFLVVFASGNDRRIPGARLHTSFQLSAGGEYLALVRPDGTTVATEFAPSLPQQVPDVSFGFAQVAAGDSWEISATDVYFTTPTPGSANLGGTAVPGPVIAEVGHEPNVPLDHEDLIVTAAVRRSFQPVAGVTLRYRIQFGTEASTPMLDDGLHGDGLAGDGVYGAIIPANLSTNGQLIRYAITATDTTARNSRWPLFTNPTSTEEYLGTIVNPTNLTSKLPIFHLFVAPTQLGGIDSENGGRVTVFYDGELYDNIYMELRGNTSASLNKKSHRLEFNRGHEFRHAGPGGRTRRSALLAEYLDPAYLRQHLSFWFLNLIGVPAPYHYPVRVQMNGQFYQLAFHNDVIGQEQVERLGYDPNGALYKAVGNLVPNFSSTGVFQKLEPDEDPTRTDYLELANGINESSSAAVRRRTVFDLLDLPQVINHLAGTRWCAENDDVWANMSMYRDTFGDGLWRNIPFDMNASWGQLYGGSDPLEATVDGSKSHPLYGGSSTGGNYNRLYDVIVQLPETRQMLLRRERSIMDGWIQPPGTPAESLIIENHIKQMTNLIAAEAVLDRAKWGNSPWAPSKSFSAGVGDLLNQFVGPRRRHWYVTHSITNTSRPIGISSANNAGIPLAQPHDALLTVIGVEFNPSSHDQRQEYVCLSNTMPYAVDLTDWKVGGGVEFRFRPGTVVPSNGVIYLSPHTPSFRARASGPRGGQGLFVVGPYQGQLSARGESLWIENAYDQRVSSYSYDGSPSLAQEFLRVTEIMFHPTPLAGNPLPPDEFEYLELKNISTTTALDLRGIRFTNGVLFGFTGSSLTTLAPGARVLIVKNLAAFTARYGSDLPIAGEYVGSLDNDGEQLRLLDGNGEEILDFEYDDDWFALTDGLGFSLQLVDETAAPDSWSNRDQWQPSAVQAGSPGAVEPVRSRPPTVWITEALTRTDTPPPLDSIELHNPGTTSAAIGGWWLTDDLNTPNKFKIPAGTVIPPQGYVVFDENDFNLTGNGFGLGADGDEVWLLSADSSGALTGFIHGHSFGAADNGVSFGLHVTSTGKQHFVAQSQPSLGSANHPPRVGPVVIQEIFYHPAENSAGEDVDREEYIELLNLSSIAIPLFDPAAATNTWHLRGGVDYEFPANVTLTPGEYVLLVNFNPTNTTDASAFRAKYNVPSATRLFGPYRGKLDNSQGTVELKTPTTPTETDVPYVTLDRVNYEDGSPWPPGADGYGLSLQRRVAASYGNDPINWIAAVPSPGTATRSGTAPQLLNASRSQNVTINASITLGVESTGPDLAYQWRWNGMNLPGATNSTLNLAKVQPSQMGGYRVVIYNAFGSVTAPEMVLTMTAPTLILQQPAGTTVSPGVDVSLTVTTRSPWNLRYQWYRNGVELAGETASTLKLGRVAPANGGDYTVVVSDPISSLTSAPARLVVAVPPSFTLQPISQGIVAGGPLILTGSVTNSATPPVGFRILRNGLPVGPELAQVFVTDGHHLFVRIEGTNAAPPWVSYAIVATNPASPAGVVSAPAAIEYLADLDSDGLADSWENILFGTAGTKPEIDTDQDGLLDREEYVAGTDPTSNQDRLQLAARPNVAGLGWEFLAVSNRTYTVQSTDRIATASWRAVAHVLAFPTNRVVSLPEESNSGSRFYRIITPFQP
ncbi:MAG: lamin tail domain-containing protein [Verrucomicrobiales bacterium]|nr:lamin tail domain-containing protein [Verrucomicrobiales bacterium]